MFAILSINHTYSLGTVKVIRTKVDYATQKFFSNNQCGTAYF